MTIAGTTSIAHQTPQGAGSRRWDAREASAFIAVLASLAQPDRAQPLLGRAQTAPNAGSLRELAGVTESRELARDPSQTQAAQLAGIDQTEPERGAPPNEASSPNDSPSNRGRPEPGLAAHTRHQLASQPSPARPSTPAAPPAQTDAAPPAAPPSPGYHSSHASHASHAAPAATPASGQAIPAVGTGTPGASAAQPGASSASTVGRVAGVQAARPPQAGTPRSVVTAPRTPSGSERAQRAVAMQASRGLAHAMRSRDGTVRFRLNPANLGSLRVAVRVDQAGVIARFEASTEAARAALDASQAHLRAALHSRGLEVQRLEIVHTPPPSQDHSADAGQDQHAPGQADQHARDWNGQPAHTETTRLSAEADDEFFDGAESAEPLAPGPLRVVDGAIRLDALA